MAYSSYNFFTGELDGKHARDFSKMDYTKENLKDRIEFVEDLLNDSDYFVEYFDNHFKVNLTAGDALSEEINVCKILENMANYLLNSEDVRDEDRKNKPVYVFHKNNERFEKKINRESFTIKSFEGSFNMVDDENIVHSLEVNKSNSRLPMTQRITSKDLEEDSKCGEVLRDYKIFLDHINRQLKKTPGKSWRYLSNAKAQVQDDMIMTKDFLKGVWGYNIDIKESCVPDLDVLDFTDIDTVRFMMEMEEPDFVFNHDMRIVWNDFNNVVKQSNLNDEESVVFKLLQHQWKMVEISEELNIKYDRLRRTIIPNIAKKITKVGCKYDAEDSRVADKIKKRKEEAYENK